MKKWVIYGAGGHARVIADLIHLQGGSLVCFFTDDTVAPDIKNTKVRCYDGDFAKEALMIIAIGNNVIRKILAGRITHTFGALVHPLAFVADDVKLGKGTVVLAGAVIQSGAYIGEHVIVNAGVVIDHNAYIGDYTSIYPNAYIGGDAVIGNGTLINPGAVIMRNSCLAADTIIAPNTVVDPVKKA